MRIVEIKTSDGIVLAARPGGIPALVIRSGDRLSLQAMLRRFPADKQAIGQVRRQWRALGMANSAAGLTDSELAAMLRRKLSSGQLDAVFLRNRSLPSGGAMEHVVSSPVVHVPLPGMTLLIASKGRMPQEFARHTNNRHAAEIVRKISQDSRAAKMIDNHAHRLPGGTVKKVTGISLRQHIAHQIDVGAHEAVVLTTPVAIAKAAARTDAPKPVSQMSVIEKVTAALKLSIRHLPAELATAAAFTVIMEIGIFLAGLIPAQFIPVGGEVLDVALAAIAYAVAGLAGIYAVWQLVHATYIAASAKTDADLDEAGKEYAAGFVAIGVAKLAKLRAKLLEGRLGGAAEEVEGKASRNIGQRTSREPQPEESTQSSAKSNAAAATPSLEDLALAGSKPVRVLQGTNGKTAVIGRSMGDGSAPGVRSYAKAFENQFGPIETFDGPVISSGAKREWADLTSGGQRLTDSEIKETLLYKENVAWSENLKAKGYTILDLGDPAMQDASAFYEIEKKVIFGD